MVQVMSSPTSDQRPTPRRRTVDDQTTFLSRWLKVWVILLTVVTLVVVAYLVIITNSLASINGDLATADRSVAGAGGNVVTLPNQVDRINGALAGIDPALKPIPGQVDQILAALGSISTKLSATDASLKDTSSVLQTVLGTANSISGVLVQADHPNGDCGAGVPCSPGLLGVQNIHERVDNANRILTPARADVGNILADLSSANTHLLSACKSTALQLLKVVPC